MKSIENGDTLISRIMIDQLARVQLTEAEIADRLFKHSAHNDAIPKGCQKCNQLNQEITHSVDDFSGRKVVELKSRCRVGGCVKMNPHPARNISNRGMRFDALLFDEMLAIGPAKIADKDKFLMGRWGDPAAEAFNKIFDRHLADVKQRKKFFQDRQSLANWHEDARPEDSTANQEEPEERKEFNDKPVTKADFYLVTTISQY